MNLEEMRANYTKAELTEASVGACPIDQLSAWLEEAEKSRPASWMETNAMTLSTCDANYVTARLVLLKKCSHEGLFFYTNRESQKGQQLRANARCALVFYWPHLERQVRIEGVASLTSDEDSETYFQSRPRGSQIGAAASEQSVRVAGREVLEQQFAQIDREHSDSPIPRPSSWGGYCVDPTLFEFWQGRRNRLHDRIVYEKEGEGWDIFRRAP